jgi:hypothetical protein
MKIHYLGTAIKTHKLWPNNGLVFRIDVSILGVYRPFAIVAKVGLYERVDATLRQNDNIQQIYFVAASMGEFQLPLVINRSCRTRRVR